MIGNMGPETRVHGERDGSLVLLAQRVVLVAVDGRHLDDPLERLAELHPLGRHALAVATPAGECEFRLRF